MSPASSLALACALLVGCAASVGPAWAASDPTPFTAVTVLPPGNSGFVDAAGQVRGTASGNPGDFGPHIDDQREMYWKGTFKPGDFSMPGADADQPRPGVRIDRDPFGVPIVAGDSAGDVWWGAGYAAGQDRLFLADAVRRYARGTYAELVGPDGLEVDRQARQVTYSDDEYAAMLAALPLEGRTALTSYAEGLNAWITKVRADPRLLPAEYALLTTLPAPWTVTDTMAAGVLITRTVASAGGDEFRLVESLRTLEKALGRAEGRRVFRDLNWQDDASAPTTVPAKEGRFRNQVAPTRSDFDAAADWALSLPPELGEGISAGVPAIPGEGTRDPDAFPLGATSLAAAMQARTPAAGPAQRLVSWARALRGGSFGIAVSPARSATGGALLESAPQLGYSYPSVLWELEVHGAGYDARGISVPGIPTVGIGYGKRVAWALTTGNTKTIDSFVEKVRVTAGTPEYLSGGTWRPQSCRPEVIRYRQSLEGVPFGLPLQSETLQVCRTGRGPVVSTSNDGTLARSLQLAMWKRELETISGILAWNRVDDLASFRAAVDKVTWNENVLYADADGHIAYWHPGLIPSRPAGTDTRFPSDASGGQEWLGLLPVAQRPYVADPAQGWLANWNGKPSSGWSDTWLGDPSSARPAGTASRLRALERSLAADDSVSMADLQAIDRRAGSLDHRHASVVPLVLRLLSGVPLSPSLTAARDLLASWNGVAYGPGAGTSPGALDDESVTDGPAPTLFRALAQALPEVLLRDVPVEVLRRSDATYTHVFDATPVDNLVLRVLDPASSSLTAEHDYLAGRSRSAVVTAALQKAVATVSARYGADPSGWRVRHPRSPVESLTGVIGPSLSMPFEDRGSWEHLVAYTRARPSGSVPAVRPEGVLAATGPASWPGIAGLLLLGAVCWRRFRPG